MCYLGVIESYLKNKGLDDIQIEGFKGNMVVTSSDLPDIDTDDSATTETEYD